MFSSVNVEVAVCRALNLILSFLLPNQIMYNSTPAGEAGARGVGVACRQISFLFFCSVSLVNGS